MPIIAVTSARLDTDNRKVRLTLASPITKESIMSVAYTKGTVKSSNGVALESFSNKSVTNNVTVSTKQTWSSFQPSPLNTSQYPYQVIVHLNDDHKDYLICSKYKLWDDYTDTYITNLLSQLIVYIYDMGEWNIYNSASVKQKFTSFVEANNDVYTDYNFTTVRFTKTTTT